MSKEPKLKVANPPCFIPRAQRSPALVPHRRSPQSTSLNNNRHINAPSLIGEPPSRKPTPRLPRLPRSCIPSQSTPPQPQSKARSSTTQHPSPFAPMTSTSNNHSHPTPQAAARNTPETWHKRAGVSTTPPLAPCRAATYQLPDDWPPSLHTRKCLLPSHPPSETTCVNKVLRRAGKAALRA
jgi:hypothetical protein